MEQSVFKQFSTLIYRESGIVLPNEKLNLLVSRIQKRLLELGIKDESRYLQIIETDASGEELARLIDLISTNVTYFYREEGHFKVLRELLAELKAKQKKEIKIWCAAASSGEEPYTLAFEASEVLSGSNANWSILATDICSKVLNKAVKAEYPDKVVAPVPADIKVKYLEQLTDGGTSSWRVKASLAAKVSFNKLNLIKFPYQLKAPIDIIFCRNVMIYFDRETRQKIVHEMTKLLAPGGHLFISHSENLMGFAHQLQKTGASIYKKQG